MNIFSSFFNKKKTIEELNEIKQKNEIKENIEFNEPIKKLELNTEKKYKIKKQDNLDENKKHYEGHRQRIKEKILNNHIESMQDYEILEALLMYSIPRNDVKPLAKELLNKYKTLKNIVMAPTDSFTNIKGIAKNTLCFFKIIHEVYCRFDKEEIDNQIPLNTPDKVALYCQSRMSHLNHEQFRVLFLNKKNQLIKDLIMQNGTIDKAAIFPREIIATALNLGAGGLILVHNHPSGDPTPSKADFDITEQIKKSANTMDMMVFDHIIVGKNKFYSMKTNKITKK